MVRLAGRGLVTVTTDPDADDAALDLTAVEAAFREGARTFLLCNPHNPLGRVPRRAELEALRELAAAYDVRVVADEIHGPLTLPGAMFTPYLTVDPTAVMVISAPRRSTPPGALRAAGHPRPGRAGATAGLPGPQNHAYSPLGMIAAAVAWRDCDAWLASLVRRLADQRDLLAALLPEHLRRPGRPLEATYLAWLDLRAYGVDDPAGDALAHGVKVAPGATTSPAWPGTCGSTSPPRPCGPRSRCGDWPLPSAGGGRSP